MRAREVVARICSGLLAPLLLSPGLVLANSEVPQIQPEQALLDFLNQDDQDNREDRSRGRTGTSRNDNGLVTTDELELCILTPGRNETVWHRQPLLVMKGLIERVEVQPWRSRTSLWSQALAAEAANLHQVTFQGEPLAEGNRFEWVFYQTLPNQSEPIAVYRLPFTMMGAGAERDQIAADLAQIDREMAEHADAEAIAQAKTAYFLEQNLPADALHELFSVASPSPSFAELQTETVDTICSQLMIQL